KGMSPQSRKLLLIIVLVLFCLLQVYNTFIYDGGIVGKYGFWQAFPEFFTMSWGDPLLAAGLSDFMMVIAIVLVWLLFDLPADRRWGGRTWLWLISYIVFPGLGLLLY